MAVGSIFDSVKNKARSLYNRFFYDSGEAPSPRVQEQEYPPQEQGQWQNPAPYTVQEAYQAQPPYQQPYNQTVYQGQVYNQGGAPASGFYQQPAQQSAQQPAQGRFRRSQQHAAQQPAGEVVSFTAYQQRNQAPQAQPVPQPMEQDAEAPQVGSLLNARVINARGMGDCRSAITLLRNGDAVVIVMESISNDPAEMRRMVDTLSGACYSLTATITKVSRHGVYLLAPQALAVFADQATNAMNAAPARAQARNYQPGYTGQRVSYAPQQPAQQQSAQPAAPYPGGQGFTQRSAAQEEPDQRFYQRPAPQAAQAPAFSAQPAGYGYAPDESALAE